MVSLLAFLVLDVVEQHAAVRQREVADEMLAADDALDRQVGRGRVDVRDQVQARRRKPACP